MKCTNGEQLGSKIWSWDGQRVQIPKAQAGCHSAVLRLYPMGDGELWKALNGELGETSATSVTVAYNYGVARGHTDAERHS